MLEKPLEPGNAARPTDQPGMEAGGDPGRVLLGLAPERVEGVDAVSRKVFGVHEGATGM
jgi:hypothetical protein